MPTLDQPLSERERAELSKRIVEELRRLRIPGNVHGFFYLTAMLLEVVPDHSRLFLITKYLYPDVGRAFGVTAHSVERAVRTAISICWNKGGRDVLDEMACYHLEERPTSTQFLDIVASHIRRMS